MNACLNYFIEANLGLVLFLGTYMAVLRRETNFTVQRSFLLIGILVSLISPLFHFQYDGTTLPSISQLISPLILPEVIVSSSGESQAQPAVNGGDILLYVQAFYAIGLVFFLVRFVARLTDLLKFLKKPKISSAEGLKIVEHEDVTPTFSFFHFIVLSRATSLSPEERQNVIHHEAIHARQLHSFDILLVNVLGIFFWFNPLLGIYKRIFVQLHEFEADARAVENRDVNEYCNLLARVALESAGFRLANHFNNSLTVKRIEMMRTIKRKIRPWKMLLLGAAIPLAFIVVACQDQMTDEVSEIAKISTMALDVPPEVQQTYDELVKTHPDKKYLIMETDENLEPKLAGVKAMLEKMDESQISHIQLITPTVKDTEPKRTFAIVEYNEFMEKIGERSKQSGDVYTIVDDTSTPEGGIGRFFEHVQREIKYPAEARRLGIEGKVFVTFIVNTDGTVEITDISGIGGGCNLEALRVVQLGPKWIPGKINGVAVRQQMTLPITFKLDQDNSQRKRINQPGSPKDALSEVVVVSYN